MGETLKLTAGETIEILSSLPDLFEVEASYGPGGEPPPAHMHPKQAERFEVLEGSVHAKVAGTERELKAGETIEIPARTAHQMWNPSDAPARVRWQTRPALRTEEWFRRLDRLQREGKTSKDGKPKVTAMLPLILRYRDVFRLAR